MNPMDDLSRAAAVESLFAVLRGAATEDYVGEPISQLEHALQCAALAEGAGASDDEVLAALFHDLGHLTAPPEAPRMGGLGVLFHETVGAAFLRAHGMDEAVCALVAGHVQAKRYLVATRPAYAAALSPASTGTLAHQGGPMSAAEVAAWDAEPRRDAWLRLRSWDERAKVPGAPVPSLDHYRLRCLARLTGPVTAP